jgi:hypothetical protein
LSPAGKAPDRFGVEAGYDRNPLRVNVVILRRQVHRRGEVGHADGEKPVLINLCLCLLKYLSDMLYRVGEGGAVVAIQPTGVLIPVVKKF